MTSTLATATHAIDPKSQAKYRQAIVAIQKAKELLAEIATDNEIGAFFHYTEAAGHLQQAIEHLVYAKPSALCRTCQGDGIHNNMTCFQCKGHGWLPAGVVKTQKS